MQREAARGTAPSDGGIGGWVRECVRRGSAIGEYLRLRGAERERLASDLAVQPGDLDYLVRAGSEALELPAMMRRAGIREPIAATDLGLLRDMQRVCSLCRTRNECRRFLAGEVAGGYGRICPNAGNLDYLAARSMEQAACEEGRDG
ncbi:MAG: hypothetical protein KIT20_05355 [Alphaproteobacteria bacterium]|nr:hypothetical protein [Alphaproteobacteria bacterium]